MKIPVLHRGDSVDTEPGTKRDEAATDAAIKEAEEVYAKDGKLYDARAELCTLRRKYLG